MNIRYIFSVVEDVAPELWSLEGRADSRNENSAKTRNKSELLQPHSEESFDSTVAKELSSTWDD